MTEENHATERKRSQSVSRIGFMETNGTDHMLPILTVLPGSPMPYNEGRKECVVGKVDRLDVQDAIEYAEEEMTEKQKASLQIYEKNKQQIDTILEAMSEGLVELKVALQSTL